MLEEIIKGMKESMCYERFIKELNIHEEEVYIYIYYDGVEGWSYCSYDVKSCKTLDYDCCLGESEEEIAEYIYRYSPKTKEFILER